MAARSAWILNLDADLELGSTGPYRATRQVEAAIRRQAPQLAASLLSPGDVVVDASSAPGAAQGRRGRAFCPTRSALDLLHRAGATPDAAPDEAILRRVNSRAFASAMGQTLPEAEFVTDIDRARRLLLRRPELGGAWRVKHAFGMAGRNQRVLTPGPVEERELGFLTRGLRQGGLQIEPDVAIDVELAWHGCIAQDSSVSLGSLVRQRCDASGAWLATEPLPDGQEPMQGVRSRLADEMDRVARALQEAGYFGPFGVDAYCYRDAEGRRHLQPRSEINARYSMGFAAGFEGAGRPRG